MVRVRMAEEQESTREELDEKARYMESIAQSCRRSYSKFFVTVARERRRSRSSRVLGWPSASFSLWKQCEENFNFVNGATTYVAYRAHINARNSVTETPKSSRGS